MGIVKIVDVGNELTRAEKLLAGIPNGTQTAVSSALQRTVTYLRKVGYDAIKERYDISDAKKYAKSQGGIRSGKTMGVHIIGTSAEVTFRGYKIPLYRYNGTTPSVPTVDKSQTVAAIVSGKYRMVHPGITAKAHVLKSTSPKQITNTFVATMKSGHTGIYERTGGVTSSGADAVREIMGLSVPQMLENEDTVERITSQTVEKFEERMEHEIMRIMNGWGESK